MFILKIDIKDLGVFRLGSSGNTKLNKEEILEYKYFAVDFDGLAYIYNDEPYLSEGDWRNCPGNNIKVIGEWIPTGELHECTVLELDGVIL